MLAEALQAEVDDYIAQFTAERDERGRRLVVRERQPPAPGGPHQRGCGRGDRAAGQRQAHRPRHRPAGKVPLRRFGPPWCRKTPKIDEVLPVCCTCTACPPATSVPRWASSSAAPQTVAQFGDHQNDRDLAGRATRVQPARSVRSGLRLSVGRRDPRQHPPRRAQAVPAGHHRRARRWPPRARRPHRRLPRVHRVLGRPAARLPTARRARPGPRGRGRRARLWGALSNWVPQTPEQRCWFHKIANVLGALPKSAHPGAKKALAEIWNAEDKNRYRATAKAFEAAYGAKFPKAVAKITDDLEELLAVYDYPAEHWVHLRTTNPIESTFGTVRHRTKKVARGPASKDQTDWRWPTSSSRPPKPADRRGTHPTSSLWSAQAHAGRTAGSSNDPTHTPLKRPPRQPPKVFIRRVHVILRGLTRKESSEQNDGRDGRSQPTIERVLVVLGSEAAGKAEVHIAACLPPATEQFCGCAIL